MYLYGLSRLLTDDCSAPSINVFHDSIDEANTYIINKTFSNLIAVNLLLMFLKEKVNLTYTYDLN